jgi:hypothetical protein
MKDNEKFIENNSDYEEIIYIAKIRNKWKNLALFGLLK